MLKSEDLLNKKILVAIRIIRSDKSCDFVQTHGVAKKVEGEKIYLTRDDGNDFCLGFSLESLKETEPGIYKEKSTGAEIKNPDYLSQWSIESDRPTEDILKTGFEGFQKSK